MRHANQELLSDIVVVGDQVGELVRRHAHMKNKFWVVSEGSLDMVDLFLGQRHPESLVEVELELSEVEFHAHVDIPVGLRNYAWNQPVSIFKVFLIDIVNVFRNWKRSEELRSEEVRLQFVIS